MKEIQTEQNTSVIQSNSARRAIYAQAIIGGALLGITFQPSSLGWLALVAFVPFLLALHKAKNLRQALVVIYWGMFAFHGASNWWVSSWQKESDPYLMAAGIVLWLAHPFFFAVPLMAHEWLRRARGNGIAYGALPFLWVVFEWAHSLTDLSYPWQALGYTQVGWLPMIQIADMTGVWGVSFVVMGCNALCALWVHSYFATSSWKELLGVDNRFQQKLLGTTTGMLAFLMIVLGYGGRRMGLFDANQWFSYSNKARVAIVQPNINPWGKWVENAADQVQAQMLLVDSLTQAENRSPDIVLWSENAIPMYVLAPRNTQVFSALQRWCNVNTIMLIAGVPTDTLYAEGDATMPASARTAQTAAGMTVRYDTFNTSIGIAPEQTVQIPRVQKHKKARLTPFAERLPFADALTFATKWMEWGVGISGWQKGTTAQPMSVRIKNLYADTSVIQPYKVSYNTTQKVGTIICLESIYPDFVRQFTQNGANLLCITTNDGWFDGTPGPHQHFAIAQMRAVENRRTIARCANTGVSGFILPDGSPRSVLPTQQKMAVQYDVPLFDGQTIYVQYGDWFPKTALIWSCAVVIMAGIGAIRKRKQ